MKDVYIYSIEMRKKYYSVDKISKIVKICKSTLRRLFIKHIDRIIKIEKMIQTNDK